MANDTTLVIVGNLTADPELRFTQNGLPVANLTIASTPRSFNKQSNEWEDGEALFMRCSVWKDLAEHVASSLHKGDRVIAQGRINQRSYQTKEGESRTSIELTVDEIGPSLTYATAAVTRAQTNRTQQDARQGQRAPQGAQQATVPTQEQWYEPGQSAANQAPNPAMTGYREVMQPQQPDPSEFPF